MTKLEGGDRNVWRWTVGLRAALSAATFLLAVLLHVGARIPLGFVVLHEPQRPIAVIVEPHVAMNHFELRTALHDLPSLRGLSSRGPARTRWTAAKTDRGRCHT
jgi:hypothetical protein